MGLDPISPIAGTLRWATAATLICYTIRHTAHIIAVDGYSVASGTAVGVVVVAAAAPSIGYAAFGAYLNNNIKILLVIDKRRNILHFHQCS